MCLIDKKQFRCSGKKIPVWKVVWKDSEGFHSPLRKTKLHRINQVVEITSDIRYQKCNYSKSFVTNCYIFENGFFHAFTTEGDANELRNNLIEDSVNPSYSEKHIKIVTGYIPEDTRYAIDDVDGKSICARKMILNI